MATVKQRYKLSRGRRRIRYVARKLLALVITAAVVVGLVLADRYGVFGRKPVPDLQKYHRKSFRVVKVVDGDTLDVDIRDGDWPHTRVRLWGVDTPETVKPDTAPQYFGREATAFTRAAALHKEVRLELDPLDTRDRYGRLLAYVILPGGGMLNRMLIEDGYGYADPRFAHHYRSEFRRLQTEARKARRGLWKDVRNADLPYYYRDKLKLPTTAAAD